MQKNCAFLILTLIVLTGLGRHAHAQSISRNPANTPATFHMTGTAELLSHYVEHGISQTDTAPSLQGSFWFNFGPQARLGLWGSNVSYENSDAHFVLKPTADVKVNFSNNTEFTVSYSESKYYNVSDRNSSVLGLHLGIFDYRVNYEFISNWEGTSTGATYFSLGKTFDFSGWKWNNELGYTMLKADGFNNYFDLSTFIGRTFGQVFAQAGMTGTSSNSQFGSAGGYFFIVKVSTDF